MSFAAAAWAIDQQPRNTTEKLVLICLCNNADDEQYRCWPSHDYLALKAMCSPRTVRRAIKGLVEQGFVSILEDRRHKGQSNVYKIHVITSEYVHIRPETANNATGHNDLPPQDNSDLPIGRQCPEGRTHEYAEAASELGSGAESIKNQSFNQSIPAWIDKELWDEWMRIRKKLRAVNSDVAINRILKKLTEWHHQGVNVNSCIEKSITSSWKDVFRPKGTAERYESSKDIRSMSNNQLLQIAAEKQLSTHGLDREALITKIERAA